MNVSTRTLAPENTLSGTGAPTEPATYQPSLFNQPTPGADGDTEQVWPWAKPTRNPTRRRSRVVEDPTAFDRATTPDYPDWLRVPNKDDLGLASHVDYRYGLGP